MKARSILAASVVIAAGFAVAAVELLGLPKGTIWIVVAAAALILAASRRARRAAPTPRDPDRPAADPDPNRP